LRSKYGEERQKSISCIREILSRTGNWDKMAKDDTKCMI